MSWDWLGDAADFVGDEFLGVDDFGRVVKYGRQGDFGQALKSLGAGAFELGTTAAMFTPAAPVAAAAKVPKLAKLAKGVQYAQKGKRVPLVAGKLTLAGAGDETEGDYSGAGMDWRDLIGAGPGDTLKSREATLRKLYGNDNYEQEQNALFERYVADLAASTEQAKRAMSGAYGAAAGAARSGAEDIYRGGQQAAATIDQIYGGAGARAAGLAAGQGLTADAGTGLGMVGGGTLAAAPNLARAYGLTAADVAGSEAALAAEGLRGAARAAGGAGGTGSRNLDQWFQNTTAGQRLALGQSMLDRKAEREAQLAGGLAQIEAERAQLEETSRLGTMLAISQAYTLYKDPEVRKRLKATWGVDNEAELIELVNELGGTNALAILGTSGA